MTKAQMLARWRGLSDTPPCPRPIAYKHTGPAYAEDTIRLTGSMEFIDSILSQLAELLGYESGQTRLQVSLQQSMVKGTGQILPSFNCYISVRERGPQARITP